MLQRQLPERIKKDPKIRHTDEPLDRREGSVDVSRVPDSGHDTLGAMRGANLQNNGRMVTGVKTPARKGTGGAPRRDRKEIEQRGAHIGSIPGDHEVTRVPRWDTSHGRRENQRNTHGPEERQNDSRPGGTRVQHVDIPIATSNADVSPNTSGDQRSQTR